MKFHIANMTCRGCARTVTQAIHSVDAKAIVRANLESRTVEVETAAPRADVEAALSRANYPAHYIAPSRQGA